MRKMNILYMNELLFTYFVFFFAYYKSEKAVKIIILPVYANGISNESVCVCVQKPL